MNHPLHPNRAFPRTRMRRLRQHGFIRESVREHTLEVSDLILPIFVCENAMRGTLDAHIPGLARTCVEDLAAKLDHVVEAGLNSVMLFAVIDDAQKTADGAQAYNEHGLLAHAIEICRTQHPTLGVITDVALDPFTNHGHDGVLSSAGGVDNDRTLTCLIRQALVQAQAGSQVLAPSDMMDGRIGAIRQALDQNGFCDTLLMSYAVKYHSGFYGPFRQAANSATSLTQRSKADYQMQPANSDEALHEATLDLNEGADLLIVKPGMPYLDVLRRVSKQLMVPTYAYQVSGEYAMLMFGCAKGLFEAKRIWPEVLLGFKRAGACGIISYYALEAAQALKQGLWYMDGSP